jgi:hypothetical protein
VRGSKRVFQNAIERFRGADDFFEHRRKFFAQREVFFVEGFTWTRLARSGRAFVA